MEEGVWKREQVGYTTAGNPIRARFTLISRRLAVLIS